MDVKKSEYKKEIENRQNNKIGPAPKLFVGGLKDTHDEEILRDYFSQFGNVVSVNILTDKNTGKCRGFAYVEYDDYDAVDLATCKKFILLLIRERLGLTFYFGL